MRCVWLLALVTACYRPSEIAACSVSCGPAGECPTGMHCGADRRCTGDGNEDCNQIVVDGRGSDSRIDSDPALCFGGNGSGRLGQICLPALPSSTLQLDGLTIDTTMCKVGPLPGELIVVGAIQACVFSATNLTINNTVDAHGAHPLVLVSTGHLTVNAASVLSLEGQVGNPAPGVTVCTGGMTAGNSSMGAGGGAGGTGGVLGASGGDSVVPGGDPTTTLIDGTALVAGCNGIDGGAGGNNGTTPGGGGGGAVWLVAGVDITISGAITASGQGGVGGYATNDVAPAVGGGGGGGGAGGLVALDAPMVTVTGVIIANGGGGGGGASVMSLGAGSNGGTPSIGSPFSPAPHGAAAMGAGGGAGDGGDGGTDASPALGNNGNSGGGGGGAHGLVELLAPSATITGPISPVPLL